MKRHVLALALASTTAMATCTPAGAAVAKHDSTTTLNNSGRLATQALKIDGAAPTSATMSVTLQVGTPDQAEAAKLIASGTVLAPAQYAAKFGTSQASLDAVQKWAREQGLDVVSMSAKGGQVSVRGDVAEINKAFKVQMKTARLHGQRGLAVDKAPQVPASLGLTGVAGLNPVGHMRPYSTQGQDAARRSEVTPSASVKTSAGDKSDGKPDCSAYWGDHLLPSAKKYALESNVLCGYTPSDLPKMYGVSSLAKQKPTLGILLWGGDGDMKETTNDYMRSAHYPLLTDYKSVIEPVNANMKDCGPLDIQGEQALDVQSSHAIAPSAAIRYYGAASCYDADLTTELQKMVDAHEVTTISMSFGMPYDDGMTPADQQAWDRPLTEAALIGISTFASSGDRGNNSTDNDLGPNGTPDGKPHIGFPASSAWTTAVGGTSVGMRKNGSIPVLAGWENAFFTQPAPSKPVFNPLALPISGAGGGVSAVETQPTWQKGVIANSTTMRAVPDIAGLADPYTGYTIRSREYRKDAEGNVVGSDVNYDSYGGTSLSSPIVAALTGLAKATKHSNVGLITPMLYKAKGKGLNDVNQPGQAGVALMSKKFGVVIVGLDGEPEDLVSAYGWDNVTGLGSPAGLKFVNLFK